MPSQVAKWAVVGLASVWLAGCSPRQAAPEPVRAVRTVVAGQGEAALVRQYAAEIKARTETVLSFRVGGKLLERPANLGDAVRAGQVLAHLDPQDLRLSQDAAQAAVNAAQTQVDLAAADLKRFQELRAQGYISAAELDRREAALKAAQAQLEQARAQAGAQRNQTAYANLSAPTSGVVTAVLAEPGQVLAAGTPVFKLALDGPRDAVFAVPEHQVAEIRALLGKPGAVQLTLWGVAEAVPATVREIAAAADPATRTFSVKADAGRAVLRLGQTATVSVAQAPRTGVIRLPLTAVAEAQGQSVVWLLDGQKMTVAPRTVEVGGADGNTLLIRAGLKPGEEVVVAGLHMLTPGLQVKRYVERGAVTAGAPASAVPAQAPAASAAR